MRLTKSDGKPRSVKGIETERGYKECQADDGTQDGQCIRTDKESPGSLGATGARVRSASSARWGAADVIPNALCAWWFRI